MRSSAFPVLFQPAAVPTGFGECIVRYSGTTLQQMTQAQIIADLDTTALIDNSTYAVNGNGVQVLKDGTYLGISQGVANQGVYATGSDRSSGANFININGSFVTGMISSGYLQRNNGNDMYVSSSFGIYDLSNGDEFTYRTFLLNNTSGTDLDMQGPVTAFANDRTALQLLRLDDSQPAIILNGTADNNVQVNRNDGLIPVGYRTELRKDAGYLHSFDGSEITIQNTGRYLVTYNENWDRSDIGTTRTQSYARCNLNGTPITGLFGGKYLRGNSSQNERIRQSAFACCSLVEVTSPNSILELEVGVESSNNTLRLDRIGDNCRIQVYKLSDGCKSFKIGKSGTQNIASVLWPAAPTQVTYDNVFWNDAGFSISANTATVDSAGKYVFFQGLETSGGGGNRCVPYMHFGINGTPQETWGTDSGYRRGQNGANKTMPNHGAIFDLNANDAITILSSSHSAATNATSILDSGAFCGIDLSTIGDP